MRLWILHLRPRLRACPCPWLGWAWFGGGGGDGGGGDDDDDGDDGIVQRHTVQIYVVGM